MKNTPNLSMCLLALVLVGALSARADLIIFQDGRTLEGEVIKEERDHYIIKGRFGKTRVDKREVKEIRKVKSPRQQVETKWKDLEKSTKRSDSSKLFELAKFAEEHRLKAFALKIHKRNVELDPDHAGSRKALGHVRYLGQWIPFERKMKLEGKVKVGDRWVSQEEAEKAGIKPGSEDPDKSKVAAETDDEERKRAIRERMEKLTGISGYSKRGEKQVKCPKCSGTGISIWLQCKNCDRSDKPGYRFLGYRYVLCDRCKGAAKLPAVACALCKKTGKVYLSRILPVDGGTKKPPMGMKWCSTCNGTRFEDWRACGKCSGKKNPGYYFVGETLVACDQCGGHAKIATTKCRTCRGTGQEKAP